MPRRFGKSFLYFSLLAFLAVAGCNKSRKPVAVPTPPPQVAVSSPKTPPPVHEKAQEAAPAVVAPKPTAPYPARASDVTDPAASLFEQAQALILASQYEPAEEALARLLTDHPAVSFAQPARVLHHLLRQMMEMSTKAQSQDEKIAGLENQIKRLIEVDLKRSKKKP
ncbi:MAG: hypothetical protein ACR2L2_15725 [Acidobacteriota bacterium]